MIIINIIIKKNPLLFWNSNVLLKNEIYANISNNIVVIIIIVIIIIVVIIISEQ